MPERPVVASLAHADEQRLTVRVDLGGQVRLLDYVGQGPTWERLPPTLDFVAVALVHLASETGRNLHVDGPVSAVQLDRLAEYVDTWTTWRPQSFRPVTVTAAQEVTHVDPGCRRGAVLAFSGGVGASFALAAHVDGLLGRRSRDISTGVLVVGWDLRHGDDHALAVAHETAARSLSAYGVGTRVVATNWQQDFCPHPSLARDAGLAALLQTFGGSHDAMVVATGPDYAEELATGPIGMSSSLGRLLGSPHMPMVVTGATHRRLERLRYLRAHPQLLDALRFCHQPHAAGANCGRCERCVRTQLEMRAVGIDPQPHVREPMREQDVRELRLERSNLLVHVEAVAEHLPADDPFRSALAALLRRERRAWALRASDPFAQEAERLRTELAAARAELDAVVSSRSWRATEPVRQIRSRLRA
jgi:hypothetical protein